MKKLSIIFPVYMNQGSLPSLAAELCEFEENLAKLGLTAEVIFVDDGSTDNSFAELLRIKRSRPATKIVKLSRNFGAVAASKTGMKYVTGDCFILVAADQQDPLEQVLCMTNCWLAGHKFVVSARASRRDDTVTRWTASIYYKLIKLLVTSRYPRGGFDLMLMDRVMLPYLLASAKNTNPNMYALWLGFEPKVLYYDRRERKYGKSTWTVQKKLKFFVDTITGFSVIPIRFMSAVGLITALGSFLYGLYILAFAIAGRIQVSGFATIIVLTTFFFGLILLMLGIMGEYLWRAFDTVTAKPEAVIDETYL